VPLSGSRCGARHQSRRTPSSGCALGYSGRQARTLREAHGDECRGVPENGGISRQAKVLLGLPTSSLRGKHRATARARRSGAIGRPVLARAEFSYLGIGHHRTWLYNKAVARWAHRDVGVHCIDTLRYILQDEPIQVAAIAHFDKDSGDVEAAAILTLEFQRGTLATVLVSTRAQYRSPLEIVVMRVYCAPTMPYCGSPSDCGTMARAKAGWLRNCLEPCCIRATRDSFADAIEGNRPFPVPEKLVGRIRSSWTPRIAVSTQGVRNKSLAWMGPKSGGE